VQEKKEDKNFHRQTFKCSHGKWVRLLFIELQSDLLLFLSFFSSKFRIYLTQTIDSIPKDQNYVVQEYLEKVTLLLIVFIVLL